MLYAICYMLYDLTIYLYISISLYLYLYISISLSLYIYIYIYIYISKASFSRLPPGRAAHRGGERGQAPLLRQPILYTNA